MTYRFTIEGRLPGLNELISNCGRPWWACRATKENAMADVAAYLRKFKIPAFKNPIRINIAWIERDKRRDRDNVTGGGTKIILDAMQTIHIIENDSRRWVLDIVHDTTQIDKKRPRIEITIQEVELNEFK